MTSQIRDSEGHPFPAFPYGVNHVVAYTDTAAAMAGEIAEGCRLARVWASTDCHIVIGTAPVADANDVPLTAKVAEYIVVRPGDKVSAIRQTDNGNLHVTELL